MSTSQYFLCGEQDQKRIVNSIMNAETDDDLRDALNDALARIDMQQADDAEDALSKALDDHCLQLDKVLEEHPHVVWRQHSSDPGWRAGFKVKP
jgi:hypothetical protein